MVTLRPIKLSEKDHQIGFEELKGLIIERLKKIDPEMAILFGSYAWGKPSRDSDIDLYVVTKDDFMPGSYEEKSEVYLKVAYLLQDLMSLIPIDLIVHTKKMYEKFIELNSYFCRQIMKKGIRLI